jgi:thiol-disulfide isomerase/thioredoxin
MQDDFPDETGGKRNRRKTAKNMPKIVMGKVYADWCGHCQALKPEWARMKKIVPMRKVVCVEINDKHKEVGIANLNRKYGVQLPMPNGYPTIFKIVGKKISYYEGARTAKDLAKWAMHGGEPEIGGKKRKRTAKKRRNTKGLLGWLKF